MRSGYVTAEVRSLGDYAVSIDTTGPEIKPSFLKSADLSGHKSICITIADTLSGIKSYDGYVDGEWVLFEYDSKNNLLTFHPDKKKNKVRYPSSVRNESNRQPWKHFYLKKQFYLVITKSVKSLKLKVLKVKSPLGHRVTLP